MRDDHEARQLARHLRRAGFNVERDGSFVRHDIRHGLHALVNAHRSRPYVSIFDIAVQLEGKGIGTHFVDTLVAFVKASRMRGLAFADSSAGAEDGGGFWRAYAAKRGFAYEVSEPRVVERWKIERACGREVADLADQTRFKLVESRIVIDPRVPHVDGQLKGVA